MSHPLVAQVQAAMAPSLRAAGERFLPVLERRLEDLAGGRGPAESRDDRRAARRFLDSVEGTWDDGDESLVRGFLDGWEGRGTPGHDRAQAVLATADRLARLHTRPETLYFFLWEMQSICDGLTPARGAGR